MIIIESRATARRTTNHRRQPSPPGSIRHDRDHRIATTPRRSRLLLVLNRLPSRSLNCAVRPSTQACNRHTQRPSQPSIPAAVACLSRYCSRRGASSSFAHTFGGSQIPIAKAAAPPPTTARGFVPWRLSDAGQRVRGSVDHRRHPKPCTQAVIAQMRCPSLRFEPRAKKSCRPLLEQFRPRVRNEAIAVWHLHARKRLRVENHCFVDNIAFRKDESYHRINLIGV